MIRCIMVLIISMVFLWSGCTQGEPGNNGDAKPLTGRILTYDPSASINNGQPIVLKFWVQDDYEDLYRPIVEAYTAIHSNVLIEIESASFNDHFNKLELALPAGLGPDLFHMHNSYSEKLISYMAPYDPEILPYEILGDEFDQVNKHLVNGNLYYIDIGMMTSSIFYNKKMWEEAGLTDSDFPSTWEELRSLSEKLTLRDEEGGLSCSGFNPNGQGCALYTAMNIQRGQRLFEASDRRTPVLDTPESRASLEFIRSFYEMGITDVYAPLCHESFGAGNSALMYSWGWNVNWLEKHFPDLEFGTFPTPVWRDFPDPVSIDRNNGESSFGVSRSSTDAKKKVAFDFICFFLARDDFLFDINHQMGTVPTKKGLEESLSEEENAYLSAFRVIMDRTFYPGNIPDYYENDINEKLIDPVIIDGSDINEAFQTLENSLLLKMSVSHFLSLE